MNKHRLTVICKRKLPWHQHDKEDNIFTPGSFLVMTLSSFILGHHLKLVNCCFKKKGYFLVLVVVTHSSSLYQGTELYFSSQGQNVILSLKCKFRYCLPSRLSKIRKGTKFHYFKSKIETLMNTIRNVALCYNAK